MHRTGALARTWAILLGIFLLVEGIWGLSSPVVFGVLTTNWLHAVIEIVLGLAGLRSGLRGGGRGWCLFVGWILLLVGILYWIPVAGTMVTGLLAVNQYVAGLNIVVGIITILIAHASRREVVVVETRDGDDVVVRR